MYNINNIKLSSPIGITVTITESKKCPYSEFFWSAFSRIQTAYGEIFPIFPYSVRMRKNTDQKNSQYGHFSSFVTIIPFHENVPLPLPYHIIFTLRPVIADVL